MRKLFRFITQQLPTIFYCFVSGLRYRKGWRLQGRAIIIKKGWFTRTMLHTTNGTLIIGNNFNCNNCVSSNSIGLIQPCVFNISSEGSRIVLGDNVGISGSTICARKSVTVGNNVLIGSGCLIMDNDAHPIDWRVRKDGCQESRGGLCAPVIIGNNVFVGARSIILKGVRIGDRSVVGAGSVVSQDVPADCVVAGNPARVLRYLT